MDINDSHCFPSSRGVPFYPSLTQKAEPCLNPAALINLTDFVNYLFGWLTASMWVCVRTHPPLKYSGRMPRLKQPHWPGTDNLEQRRRRIPSVIFFSLWRHLFSYLSAERNLTCSNLLGGKLQSLYFWVWTMGLKWFASWILFTEWKRPVSHREHVYEWTSLLYICVVLFVGETNLSRQGVYETLGSIYIFLKYYIQIFGLLWKRFTESRLPGNIHTNHFN